MTDVGENVMNDSYNSDYVVSLEIGELEEDEMRLRKCVWRPLETAKKQRRVEDRSE